MAEINLHGRDFLKLLDFTTQEIEYLLDTAADFKKKKKDGILTNVYPGKNVALIFEKTSTRTRCSFEVAAHDLGMGTTYLDPSGSQIGKKESIADTARVLASMYDGIEYRGFGQKIVEMLADLLTIREHFGHLKGIHLCYIGDARYNTGNSLMVACAKMGMHFTVCSSSCYYPSQELIDICREIALQTGAQIDFTEDAMEGTKGADVIYTDIWVSMGESDTVWAERIQELEPYRVTMEIMQNAGEQAVFMHCLPSFHDLNTAIGKDIKEKFGLNEMEVTDEVFESERSLVFEEAENRMHTIKAVMYATLG